MHGYSVVVVTWQSAPMLEALVATMNRHLDSAPELVVVDNASGDDTERAAREYRGEVQFVALRRNLGFGAASNVGVESAGGPAVVLLNPDVELLDSSLDRLVAFALERRALAGPRLLNSDGSVQPSASGTPVGPWPWVGAIMPGRLQPPPVRRRAEPWRARHTVRAAWLTGACVAAPRDALLELGPFDPAIHLYSEDMDLGLRAARGGIPSWFCPDLCRVVHRGGASTSIAFPRGADALAARNRRAVVRRVYGARRERAGWLAQRANLRLRVAAKGVLGVDASPDRAALEAARGVTSVPVLPASPDPKPASRALPARR
jgi:N-acetylglucosaminyl-diphospho-decaprenol L-rhamnosyltransferase